MVQNCTLNDSCGYLGDLCVSVVPSRNAMFHYTFKHTTAKWLLSCFRTSQNRATCIPCRSAVTVDEFRDGIFTPRAGLLHHLIRRWGFVFLIVTHHRYRCRHHRRYDHHMSYQQPHCRHHHHFHQYHWGSNALAYIMLWVAGGSCVTATAVTATAATTCDITYFTYFTLLKLV